MQNKVAKNISLHRRIVVVIVTSNNAMLSSIPKLDSYTTTPDWLESHVPSLCGTVCWYLEALLVILIVIITILHVPIEKRGSTLFRTGSGAKRKYEAAVDCFQKLAV
jgi:hypothetical protein